MKKMMKEGACWSTMNRILGWDFDTVASTIDLPPHRLVRLFELLDLLRPPRKRLATTLWYRLLGELRSMLLALPGTRELFAAKAGRIAGVSASPLLFVTPLRTSGPLRRCFSNGPPASRSWFR